MNIYLDVDGVISGTKSSIEDRVEFIEYLLINFTNSLYWLTTYCNNGENRIENLLSELYPENLLTKMLALFKETNWGNSKTNAIDFTKSFIWIDDNLREQEKLILAKNKALNCHYQIDPSDRHSIRKALNFLKNLES